MVFPDEKDEEDEVGGIETRSGKRLSAAAACECPAIQSTSNATMLHTLDALAKWKQSTLCFHACLKNRGVGTNIVACFNVPIPLQTAALRPFIFRTKLRTKWEMQQIGGRSCEPQQFLLCSFHFRFFDCFYRLTHMDWNVHLNLRHRVTQLLAQNPEMNAEQLINGIEPTVFSNLFNTYMEITNFERQL
ncbi:hypothetical protein niasHT_015029 [Heterodera trifolii]|uniref:Uncharacterized protein n=1 Tax=Heterodera trifolii TaxID=157864 RepID=A0ABD2L135_9BILA